MKYIIVVLTALLFSAIDPAGAEELTAEKKKLIDEFLQVTGGDRMSDLFARYYIEEISLSMLKSNPDIDEKALSIIAEEVNSVIREAVINGNAVNELSYPIYHKHLSSEDIAELIRFYKSAIGRKTMALLPTISKEAMQAGESWGRTLGPTIQQRIKQRFDQESILIQ